MSARGLGTLDRGEGRDGGAMRETGRQAWICTRENYLFSFLPGAMINDLLEPQDSLQGSLTWESLPWTQPNSTPQSFGSVEPSGTRECVKFPGQNSFQGSCCWWSWHPVLALLHGVCTLLPKGADQSEPPVKKKKSIVSYREFHTNAWELETSFTSSFVSIPGRWIMCPT